MRRVIAVFIALLAVTAAACSTTNAGAADCPQMVAKEFRARQARNVVGLTDGTMFAADWSGNRLYRRTPEGERVEIPMDGNTMAGLDYIDGELWLSHGRPANRVDVFDARTLEMRGSVDIGDAQPFAVFDVGSDSVIVQVAEGGAFAVDGSDLSVGVEIVDNGPSQQVGSQTFGMLDGRVVELKCQ